MTVSAMMMERFTAVASVHETDGFATVADKLTLHGVGAVVVLSAAGRLVGIVTDAHMVKAYSRHGGNVAGLTASDVMDTDVHSCRSDESELEIMSVMVEKHISHMAVMLGENVIGLVTLEEAVRHRLQKVHHLDENAAREPDGQRRLAMIDRHMKESLSIFALFRAVNAVQDETGLAGLDERARHLLWLVGDAESTRGALQFRDLMTGRRLGSYPTVRRYIDELMEQGFVQQVPAQDSRGKCFILSARGREVFARMTEAVSRALMPGTASTR